MSQRREPIGVIGTGYVGLVTAAGFAELGTDVYCIDIDADKIARLERGEIPIYEPGLAELVAKNRERLHFSTDIADALEHARLLFVAVGTPPTYSGDADLSAVHAVVDAMPRVRPPRAGHEVDGAGRHRRGDQARSSPSSGKDGFRYVSCPEFLKEGSAVADFLQPDRVVVGDDGDWAGDAVVDALRAARRAARAHRHRARPRWSSSRPTRSSRRRSRSSTRSPTSARRPAPTSSRSRRGMGLDDRIGPKFLQAGHRLRRLVLPEGRHARSSSSPATPATTSSCSTPSSRSTSCRSGASSASCRSTSARSSASASRCSAWRSSPTPTTCARRPRSC